MANKKRSANGEGTVFQRKDKRWVGKITLKGGKRKNLYGKTREEAFSKLRLAQQNVFEGIDISKNDVTFGAVAKEWLDDKKDSTQFKTWDTYRGLLKKYLLPKFGDTPIAKIKTVQIESFYKNCSKAGLSPTTIARHINSIMSNIFKTAIKHEIITANPVVATDKPTIKVKKFPVWSENELARFRAVSITNKHYVLFEVLINGFMRINELLALSWQDVNWEEGTLSISKTIKATETERKTIGLPKTDNSIRLVYLPQETMDLLQQHFINQREYISSLEGYINEDIVFPNSFGDYMGYNNLRNRSLKTILLKAGLDVNLTLHSLRHIGISVALSRGAPIEAISQMAGHSKVSTTYDMYVTVTETSMRKVAVAMATPTGVIGAKVV